MAMLQEVRRMMAPLEGGDFDPATLPPVLCDLFTYWNRIRGDRAMPARRDLDPLDIPALLPWVLLTDVRRDPLDFRYRLIGTAVAERSRRDYTGRHFSELPHTRPDSIVWQVRAAVVETRRPQWALAPYTGTTQGLNVKSVSGIYLPLSADGETVDMILSGAAYE